MILFLFAASALSALAQNQGSGPRQLPSISGSFKRAEKTGDASVRLRDAFTGAGWQEMGAYSADGTDGTSFAFRKGTVACLARGRWNGGADDPVVPPEDWYKVAMFCTSPPFQDER